MHHEPNPTVAEVEVTVAIGPDGKPLKGPDGKPLIVCNPNPVLVSVPNTLLAFNLRTPGFHFPGTGAIVIEGTYEDFPFPAWTLNRTTAALYDKCNKPDQFAYTVTIKHSHSGEEFSIDPIIENGVGT